MTSRDIYVDGLRLHVVEEGSGEPLVLLHGWGACVPFWKRNLPALAARHRVIAFDWPGFGDSDKPEAPYTIEWYAGVLARLLDALGLGAVHLAGHSMGGAVAIAFAHAHPDRVRRLVTVNAPVQGATAFSWRVALFALPVLRWIAWVCSKVGWIRRFAARDFTHRVPMYPEVVDKVVDCTYRSVVAPALAMRRLDLVPRFPELRLPALVLSSDRDRIVHPAQADLQRAIPGAVVRVYADVGHCPPVECPDDFNRDVLEFLAGEGNAPRVDIK